MDSLSIRNLIIRVAASAAVGYIGCAIIQRTATNLDRELAKRLPVPQID